MIQFRIACALCLGLAGACAGPTGRTAPPAQAGMRDWSFAVSGDSRNCGNLVMPAIAHAVRQSGARFYWHLGDLRRTTAPDEDFLREPRHAAAAPTLGQYQVLEWPDFLSHQVEPFGDLPFFLGIGNHETVAPKTRDEFLSFFGPLLDRPEIRAARSADAQRLGRAASAQPRTYYHWTLDGIDFVNLDNASSSFDADQLAWFDALMAADLRDASLTTVVVGMHEALPHSLGDNHSMCASPRGIVSGEQVYRRLAQAAASGKQVYLLASHSHYYLAGIYDTAWWNDPRHHAHPLPGWIVGTAGAVRYPLPAAVAPSRDARSHVYGYLLATVRPGGAVSFEFRELNEEDLQRSRTADYSDQDARFCMQANPPPERMGSPAADPDCTIEGGP